MKEIILGKYKLVNILSLLSLLLLLIYMKSNYDIWFKGPQALDFYEYYYSIYAPIFSGGKWLAGILAVLLLFPARIFRTWLFSLAPVTLIITYFLVQGISVHSSNLLNPTRAQMAANSMVVLAVLTAVLIIGQQVAQRRKKKAL